MRAPLSWLKDFAPFDDDVGRLAATLDDIGLVVERIERIGEGLGDIVVADVREIHAIAGADRIRRVVVDAGDGPLDIVCGAWNFGVGDQVPLAPVGTVLPDGSVIARRTMRGVTSNGMLCSGRELGLSEDHDGLLVLGADLGARAGTALTEALGIEPDVVFDLAVEGNRPDAWSMAGVARHLAARLGLPFALGQPRALPEGVPEVGELASLVLEAPDLCPRVTVRVLRDVRVGPSPRWIARRLTLAGMRPINNVVDASNYVMLERGQPTHPYDLDRLGGGGLLVRAARTGETLETLDGVRRTLGLGGLGGLGTEAARDCVIADANGVPVGVAGVIGGASSEITADTTTVLLETAYFEPMAIARTSRRLGVRTEASTRFERGTDPWGLDAAAERFCELLRLSAPDATPARGTLDRRGAVPEPFELRVDLRRVNTLLGTSFGAADIARLLEPLGFGCAPGSDEVVVRVPTNRPDVRPAPHGVADIVEEVARAFGYSRLARRQPAWPEPGGLNAYQRERRRARDALVGLGAAEAVTPSLVGATDHLRLGYPAAVEVANPLATDEAFLRRSLLPGLLRALAWNADRRQGDIRLFEVGTVFVHPAEAAGRVEERSGAGGTHRAELPAEHEMAGALFAAGDDDARTTVAAWSVLAEALRLDAVRVTAPAEDRLVPRGLHPTRSAWLVVRGTGTVVGALGEVDPEVVAEFALERRRLGWLEVDLGLLLDPAVVARRADTVTPVSRFPSSDVDLAFVVPDEVPADRVLDALRDAGGPLLESVTLFDVFRGPALGAGRRSLAYRLRFCALDRTLTDAEVGVLRQSCIDAAGALGAVLR